MSPGRAAARAGRHWEAFACEFLTLRGLRILERGYRCRLGELDIVCAEGPVLVIVEVRARRKGSAAAESIGPRKRQRIVNATRHYLMRNPARATQRIRFDVVAIDSIDAPRPSVRWIVDAFDAG